MRSRGRRGEELMRSRGLGLRGEGLMRVEELMRRREQGICGPPGVRDPTAAWGVTGANRLAPWQPPAARSPGASRDPTAVRSLGASRDPPAARGLPQYPWSMGKVYVYVYEETEQQHRDRTVCKSQQNDYLQKTETRHNIRQRNDHLTCAGSGSNQLQWTRSEALGTG